MVYGYNWELDWNNQPTKDMAMAIMGFGGSYYLSVKPETPFTEPAYYYLTMVMGMSNFIDEKKLGKKNYPLLKFFNGLYDYFVAYINLDDYNSNFTPEMAKIKAEKNFLKSIFTASNVNGNEVETYQNKSIQEKEIYLKDLMKKLDNKSYNNKLTAAWSSFFLTTHYDTIKNIKEGNLMYKIEQSTKKKIGYPIRGLPKYLF